MAIENAQLFDRVRATATWMDAGRAALLSDHDPVDSPVVSTTGEVFRSGVPLITQSFRHPIQAFTDVGRRPAIVMPLRAGQSVLGVLAVARNERESDFGPTHLELMSDFADRERIAHDLQSIIDEIRNRVFALKSPLHRNGFRENGHGIPAENTRSSGLTNLRRRATRMGGSCDVGAGAAGGTCVRWAAPLQDV